MYGDLVEKPQGGRSWFVLKVRSNCERLAATHLRDRGFEEFCPSYKDSVKWSDRTKITERFLFPAYVFCKLNPLDRVHALQAPGVVNFVSFGAGPEPVPEQELEQVRAMVRSGLLVTPHPFLEVGRKVRLERGPLAGIEGIVEKINGVAPRIVVSISMLQRSVSTEVERTWVLPLKPENTSGGFQPRRSAEDCNVLSSKLAL